MKVSKELLKGSTTIIILSLLKDKSMYGYEMIKAIEEKSNGIFAFKEGTLYPILHSLQSDNYVESYWEESTEGRKRKYYKITSEGEKHLKDKKKEWETYKNAVDSCLWEGITWG
ncbi:PadR family transcriptional regulator [Clostridium sp. YIM B02505]|uniref:PadR family transcriptional regulator n=1 Tax=Clostridium yunnanense TaxID=2800325 RepID=A0ABS1EKZ9_9CLOT|nr:PadR family transcriptional regulator [Clostridium yunnanense]MBK1810045.1 PadR family transcriptional regulator [Clostridium yunnanense]